MARSNSSVASVGSFLAILFFFSGCIAVVYEVVWQRQFSLVFGSSAPATAAVLAAYFAGLGTGSVVLGRSASRWKRPLRAYAALELGIAIGVLLVTPILSLVGPGSGWLLSSFGEQPETRALLKGVLAWIALALPTFCMGGTLPLLADAVDRGRHRFGVTAGLLYTTSTIGAGLGALAAPFLLLPSLGLFATILTCVVGNLALATAALALDRKHELAGERAIAVRVGATATRAGGMPVVAAKSISALAALSGFVTFALQVLWNRAFAQVHENSVHAFAIVVATFILSLAVGAQIARVALLRGTDARRLLGLSWLTGGAAAALGPALFVLATRGLEYLPTGGAPFAYAARLGGLSVLVLALPVTLLGMGFPAILESAGRTTEVSPSESGRNTIAKRGNARESDQEDPRAADVGAHAAGHVLGRILAFNVGGSVLGALAAGFLFPHLLGLWPSILALSVVTVSIGLQQTWRLALTHRVLRLVAPICVVTAIVMLVTQHDLPRTRVETERRERLLAVAEGSHGITAVVERPGSRRMKLNNHYVLGGTAATGDERMAAHIPLLVHPDPRSVAFLGVGTGITASGALFHANEKITVIELVPEVIDFAGEYFSEANAGVVEDRRTRVVVEDARNYLRSSKEKFDVIVGDLVVPWRQGEGALLTLESFQSVRDHLAGGGIYCQWLPLFQLTEEELRVVMRTFLNVFPEATVWRGDFSPHEPAIALLGWADGFSLDAAVVRGRVGEMRADPTNPHLAEPMALWMYCAGFIHAEPGKGRLNREDDPWIELAGPLRARADRLCTGERLASLLDELYVSSSPEFTRLGDDVEIGTRAGLLLGKFTAQMEAGDESGAARTQTELTQLVPERLAQMLFP